MRIVSIFNTKIDDVPIDKAVDMLADVSGFKFVVTPNVQHFIALDERPDIKKCYERAYLTLCDSKVVQRLGLFIKKPIRNVVLGSDLTEYYFENVLEGDVRVMIVGSTERDIQNIKNRYGIENLYHYAPPMGFIESEAEVKKTIAVVLGNKPEFLFIALGFPRQELIACRLESVADFDCAAFCIGASIDFLTGKQKRAPKIIQVMSLEWFYRFLMEPKRLFRRYFIEGLKIIPLFFGEIRRGR